MKKITGLGGVFIKARDPQALAAWYQQHLGIGFNGNSYIDLPFTDEQGKLTPGSNVLSFFAADSAYFNPSEKQVMINLRVHNLHELLDQLRADGVTVAGDPLNEEYGKFGWILDPEGNKIELWEPPATN
ncbi:MAG: VOC family protein [Chitinophagaceae bacterium]|nr:VOC family protein [Chitinophagaceae bacterium]